MSAAEENAVWSARGGVVFELAAEAGVGWTIAPASIGAGASYRDP